MGKSLRSKTKLKYRNELRSKVFEPEEDARRRRLAEKLMGNVKQAAKDEKKAGNKSKDSKDTDKDGEAMDEDEEDEENKDKEIADKDGESMLLQLLFNATEILTF